MRNKANDNKLRRAKSRIQTGGMETRGRKPGRYTRPITDKQWAFSQAVVKYKADKKIRFLANSEILEMILSMGYVKCTCKQ